MRKIRIIAASLCVTALAALGAIMPLAASAANKVVPTPFPSGTKVYFVPSSPSGSTVDYAVVATSGVNVSETASFTIGAGAESGSVWSPEPGPQSAFSAYLEQIGTWFYGPGSAWAPAGCYQNPVVPTTTAGLTLIASLDNAETNNVKTYIYEGNGGAQAADTIRDLLTTGNFTNLPASLDPGPHGQCF